MGRVYDIVGKVGNEQAFRQEIRDWLAEKIPAGWRKPAGLFPRPALPSLSGWGRGFFRIDSASPVII